MAERLAKVSTFGEYQAYHFNAAQSNALIDATHTHGTFLGHIVVNTLGSGLVITLRNGASAAIAVLNPSVTGSIDYETVLDSGLYVQLAGTGFDVAIAALAMAV